MKFPTRFFLYAPLGVFGFLLGDRRPALVDHRRRTCPRGSTRKTGMTSYRV